MERTRRATRAVTLVEMVIAVFLFTLIAGVVYKIWSQSSFEMSRSMTRQALQQEVRRVGETISNDLKSSKAGTVQVEIADSDDRKTIRKVTLDRYIETQEGKASAQSTERVVYDFNRPTLTRTALNQSTPNGAGIPKTRLLSFSIEALELVPGSSTESLPDVTNAAESAKGARVDITIVGKRGVPGSRVEEVHIERTSAVMRDQFYHAINPGYRSNFDLASMSSDKIVVAGDGREFSMFETGTELKPEDLKKLETDDLRDLRQIQSENLSKLRENIGRINQSVADLTPSRSFGTWAGDTWSGITGGEKSTLKQLQDLAGRVRSSNDQSTLTGAVQSCKEIEGRLHDRYLDRVYGTRGTDEKDRELRLLALKWRIQDRTIKIANNKTMQDYEKQLRKNPNTQRPESLGTRMDYFGEEMTAAKERLSGESDADYNARVNPLIERERKIREYYDKADLREILGGGKNGGADGTGIAMGKEDEDFRGYEFSQRLNELAASKLTSVKSAEIANTNIRLIDNELSTR